MRFTLAILTVILLHTWYLDPRLPRGVAGALPVGIVAALGVWHSARTREWGLAWPAFRPALRAAGLVTLPAVALILLAGAWTGTIHDRRDFLGNLAWLVLWGGAQQWILQTVVLYEARRARTRRAGVVLAAILFAAVHLPNPLLTALTLAGGLAWCAIYARYPNLVPLALSHALLTLAILYAFDDAITGRLRIGYGYLLLER
jgi:membrane protease YdiL (CAAX protease family)